MVSSCISTTVVKRKRAVPNQKDQISKNLPCPLEHTDVVADPLFLVLCYALGNPCDVADFLGNN